MMWGAAMWGGSCCHAGWGGGNVYINDNNNFNRRATSTITATAATAGGNWQHNPSASRRRAVCATRGPPTIRRIDPRRTGAAARRRCGQSGVGGQGQRGAGAGAGAGVSDRSAAGRQGQRSAGASDRSAGAGAGRSGGGDPIGNREIPRDAGRSGGQQRVQWWQPRLRWRERAREQLAGFVEHGRRGILARRRRGRRRTPEMSAMTRIARKRPPSSTRGRAAWVGLVVVTVFTGACGREAARGATSAAREDTAGAHEDTTAAREDTTAPVEQRRFGSPKEAVAALVEAAERFDRPALVEILGSEGKPLVLSRDSVADRKHAADFAAQAKEKRKDRAPFVGEDRHPLDRRDRLAAPDPAREGRRSLALRRRGRRARDPGPPHRRERARCHRRVPRLRRGRSVRTP